MRSLEPEAHDKVLDNWNLEMLGFQERGNRKFSRLLEKHLGAE